MKTKTFFIINTGIYFILIILLLLSGSQDELSTALGIWMAAFLWVAISLIFLIIKAIKDRRYRTYYLAYTLSLPMGWLLLVMTVHTFFRPWILSIHPAWKQDSLMEMYGQISGLFIAFSIPIVIVYMLLKQKMKTTKKIVTLNNSQGYLF